MRRVLVAFVCMIGVSAALAQEGAPRKPLPGGVTGHVVCGDTQRPARLAKVALVTAPTAVLSGRSLERDAEIGSSPATEYVETTLDGSYTIRNVPPGSYYLIVDKEGYTLPLAQFSSNDLIAAEPSVRERMAKILTPVNVTSDNAITVDVTLERGAAVTGSVSYDDGSPAAGLSVSILSKDAKGKWVSGAAQRYRSSFGNLRTDDLGRYRLTGLAPGEYVTKIDMELNEYTTTTSSVPGHPEQSTVMRMQRTRYSLPLFSGNVLRDSLAVPYTLGRAEERHGEDLQFPLAKLHRVTGQAITKEGLAVNSGTATLVHADDGSKVTDTAIDANDSAFHLEFVPEGEFKLKITGAKIVTKVQVANPPGTIPRFRDEEKTLRNFGDAEQALVVHGETQGVVVQVQEDVKRPAGASAAK